MPPSNACPQLPRYDSNVDCLVQSQECYQLHHRAKFFRINKKPRSLRRASGSLIFMIADPSPGAHALPLALLGLLEVRC